MQGLIIKLISGDYTVVTEDKQTYVCKPRGTFRLNEISPKVGDRVIIDPENRIIMELLPRKNDLIRPFVSNVDKMFLIFPVKEPDLNLNLLDRMLAILEYNEIESIIVFSKIDLLNDLSEFEKISNYYQKIGYKVYKTSKFQDNSNLLNEFKNSISVFAGQRDRKSTRLNSSHVRISYAVFCLKKKKKKNTKYKVNIKIIQKIKNKNIITITKLRYYTITQII